MGSTQSCCGCLSWIDPSPIIKRSTIETPKIVKIATVTFLITLITVIVVTLITKYPTASTAFYTAFSVTGALSFVMIAIHLIKRFGNRSSKNESFSDSDSETEQTKADATFPDTKSTATDKNSSNPFEQNSTKV